MIFAIKISSWYGIATPVTMRVVHIELGTIPTFTASTPASISANTPAAVATFPPMCAARYRAFLSLTVFITLSRYTVNYGTPTPVTMQVVHIELGTIPTFTASTPASISVNAPAAVATFPPMCAARYRAFLSLTVFITLSE
ncbi:hypothetical protein ANAPC5_00516 [Anaplasma phagocytophilum]|nr:hypothetical protein ANAPC2_00817 [Anaplasma phagocytophilum]SBO32102.1 hypothetical protein ANAPC3_00748 [Anaplasma phagocytophilum]SBO32293.1 hypothetical protein ANAPC4_00762 [Anaplasma phagocytophilum]SCV63265.1 hypothetical protein ANAPC5_00516 [Anaplasma phagocytophilum]